VTLTKRYLNLPVKNGAPKRWARLLVDGRVVREFEIELAEGEPDFWAFLDVSPYLGTSFRLEADGLPAGSAALAAIAQSDSIEGGENLYRERLRPQFHFSTRRGWTNDPNGLVYYEGEYHLCYQHNPYGVKSGNLHWGHAVSEDLVHWQELRDALLPDDLGLIFSGSAVVDWENTAGFQAGREKALVAIYTAAGDLTPASKGRPFTQCLAYSTDRGRTWTKHEGNPVLGHLMGGNRDPKVIWHAPTRKWVMALFLDPPDDRPNYALFGSPDLKQWTRLCDIKLPCTECPDFFELPVDGDPANRKWVFWGADGHYLVGSFDGSAFTPEAEPRRAYEGNAYAAQTFSDLPARDGRRVQIAWLVGDLPGMPFNHQMTFPVELTLRTTEDGVRLFSCPVKEIELLRAGQQEWRGLALDSEEQALDQVSGDLLDISAEFAVGSAAEVGLTVRGIPVAYDARAQQLSCQGRSSPLKPVDGKVSVRILLDRASVEVFGNDGRASLPIAVIPPDDSTLLAVFAKGGSARIEEMTAWELRPIWE